MVSESEPTDGVRAIRSTKREALDAQIDEMIDGMTASGLLPMRVGCVWCNTPLDELPCEHYPLPARWVRGV